MKKSIRFILNGTPVVVDDGDRSLLWSLRTDFKLTGTKYGCGEGECGVCTVLVDGVAERSCLLLASDVEGRNVTTIEGLSTMNDLHPVQKAFIDENAIQCGFCTPGMILSAVSLLKQNPNPSEQEIIESLDENLCRCGAHGRIIKAVQSAATVMEVSHE